MLLLPCTAEAAVTNVPLLASFAIMFALYHLTLPASLLPSNKQIKTTDGTFTTIHNIFVFHILNTPPPPTILLICE